MEMPFASVLEMYNELQKRKTDIANSMIQYRLAPNELQELVAELKENEKRIKEIERVKVDASFLEAKTKEASS